MQNALILTLALLLAAPVLAEVDRNTRSTEAKKIGVVADTLLVAFPTRRVVWCIIEGGAADEVVIFRAVDDTPEYQRVTVPAGTTVTVKLGQNVGQNGMEVLTDTIAGDVSVMCTYKLQP